MKLKEQSGKIYLSVELDKRIERGNMDKFMMIGSTILNIGKIIRVEFIENEIIIESEGGKTSGIRNPTNIRELKETGRFILRNVLYNGNHRKMKKDKNDIEKALKKLETDKP